MCCCSCCAYFSLLFDHLLRAREKEKEGDILKRNSGIAISYKTYLQLRFFSFSERDVNDEKKKVKKKRRKKKENVPTSEIAVCPGGGIV